MTNESPIARATENARDGWREEIERLAKRENEAASRRCRGRVWKPE